MNGLTKFDAASLAALNRALIGFDRIFNEVETRHSQHTNYPPFNVIKHDEENIEIEIAVAGFYKEDLTVEVDQDQLIVKGRRLKDDDASKYVYRGLAARDFDRAWTLAEHMEVGGVSLTNGILSVKITRIIPEVLKPRLIEIKG
jgi:molecular chaperone IbpA